MELAGIYARISVERRNQKEESIENQIVLARKWIEEQNAYEEIIKEYKIYEDHGYSGTNFSRPALKAILKDAQSGRIHCVLCKDFSRLGRDYLQTGELIEKILPSWGIRLVCISDRYDSAQGMPGSLEGNLRNLMNEWYAKDIGRKVHLVKQQKKKEGNYLGSIPPYGYQIVWKDGKRVLEKEEETGNIVEQICAWYDQGKSMEEIRTLLQSRGILTPVEYRKKNQVQIKNSLVKKWDRGTLMRVITHQRG